MIKNKSILYIILVIILIFGPMYYSMYAFIADDSLFHKFTSIAVEILCYIFAAYLAIKIKK